MLLCVHVALFVVYVDYLETHLSSHNVALPFFTDFSTDHHFTRCVFTRFYEVVHWEEGARPGLECGIYCAPYCLLLVPKEAACVSVAFCPCLLL